MAVPEQAQWNRSCIAPVPEESRLAQVRYCSPFAAHLIDRHPERFEQLQAGGRLDDSSPPHPTRAREWVAAYDLDDGLRAFRNQEILRIIWRDLNGLAALGETFSDLTSLAEICLAQAVTNHHADLCQVHGTPRDADGAPQEAVVMGLGKLGGEELNLSSDIDLLFCYPTGGNCDGRRALSNEEYFAKLSRAVISTMGDVRSSGFCFRVDTRLRPFGRAGPIAASFGAMEQYYQREGRDWERYAQIKARPVAGDREAGKRLIKMLHPFVYRRYIDFGAIEALREMQGMIRAETAQRDLRDDIKRGPGGIREIEFLAQGFQLLRGGREPALQTPRLSDALDAISDLGLLPDNVVGRLRDHYVTLRQTENRMQAMRDQQTHRIPVGKDLDRLARGMEANSPEELLALLGEIRDEISHVFDDTWAGSGVDSTEDSQNDVLGNWRRQWADWRTSADSDAQVEHHPGTAIKSFLASMARRPAGAQAARRLDRFMPMLLQRITEQGLSEAAINRLLDLVLVITQRSAYLALLAENPNALDRMVVLFSRSPWVAQRVARFPELLDELIDPALGQHIPDRVALREAAFRKLDMNDEEAALASLNYLKQASCLRLAVAWMEGRIEESAMQCSLADLADAMIDATLQMAQRELETRHGSIEGSGVAVIGYGSLGARELGFESDLDLVFLYRPGAGESNGGRPLAAERWFARLAQRMVGLLTALTPSGKLYEIDTRLRPNGQSGLLVSSIDAFRIYQNESAWTWEAQALTRARPIAGDDALMAQFEDIRLECLRRPRDPEILTRELREMRQRISESHGAGTTPELAVKHAPGGLVDIGFIAQLGLLVQGAQLSDGASETGAAQQITKLREAGWLNETQEGLLQSHLDALRRYRTQLELDAGPKENDQIPAEEGEAVAALFQRLTRE